VAKKILKNFNDELKNFKQVCPKEMLDKLPEPVYLKSKILEAI
jgi:glutamate synthase (NADPH/NADH) large chain